MSEPNDFDVIKFQVHQTRFNKYECDRSSQCPGCCLDSTTGFSDLEVDKGNGQTYTLTYYIEKAPLISYDINGWFSDIKDIGFV